MKNPLLLINLGFQYRSIKKEVNQAIFKVLESGSLIEGQTVNDFESEFSAITNTQWAVSFSSGTSALHAILMSLNLKAGDEVILPTNTCFPTVEAVCMAGAKPVLVDCEQTYYNIDPKQIEQAITQKTRAIIAVHLFGQPAQVDEINNLTDKYNLYLIEDCAQAHAARYAGTMVGNFGYAGAFSFYPTKNLGAYGEAGAAVTNDQALADKLGAFKNHGAYMKNVHQFIGHNYRMDAIQAAVLSVKLKYLEEWTNKRRQNAGSYFEHLSEIDQLVLPKQHPKAYHVFHQFVVRTDKRKELKEFLAKEGIQSAIHYPIPCHLQPALKQLGYSKGSFPISELIADQILSLPVAEHLSIQDIEYISNCIKRFFLN